MAWKRSGVQVPLGPETKAGGEELLGSRPIRSKKVRRDEGFPATKNKQRDGTPPNGGGDPPEVHCLIKKSNHFGSPRLARQDG